MTKHSDEYQPGDRLGKYEILRELATGGMATIYLARAVGAAGFEKLVVLKCILPGLAQDSSFLTMFLDEARLAATLRHANIADVFDVGVEGETYFFAMEYVHGHNARSIRLEAEEQVLPIPLEVSLAIVIATASALGYAHDRTGPQGPLGLVHRDVSPSNILVSYEGAIKLVDFGIARATTRRGRKTRTGLRQGKSPYMSPEQCSGKPIDRRSDLFSLGTVLYELTTSKRPFAGNTDFEVMDAIVNCQPEPPSKVSADYPAALEAIVMRLLAPAPQARYQTAAALLEDLEALTAKDGLLTSSHVVAKYMRELFHEHATVVPGKLDRDTIRDLKLKETTTGQITHNRLRAPADEKTPTDEFHAEQIRPADLRVKIKVPTRAGTSPAFTDERTRQDVVPPFDPIDARAAEILAQLDVNAPTGEPADTRALRRIDTLMRHAQTWLGAGEADRAVTAVELALEEDLHLPITEQLLQEHVDTIVLAYEALLEDPYRVPVLARSLKDLEVVQIDPRARMLLQFVDGRASVTEILKLSGMQRLEAYHHLCQLLLRGVIQ